MSELKQCLFCGDHYPFIQHEDNRMHVKCDRCNAQSGSGSSEKAAKELWNMRHIPQKDISNENNKKSEWLQFNRMTIRKSAITSYYMQEHTDTYFVVGISFDNANRPGEVFNIEQEAQARFDEIDREIRNE